MKKLLSILLTVCLLLTSVFVPMSAFAQQEADAEAGLYYKFDFSEDKLYVDYDNPVKPEGHDYDFVAKNTGTTVSYGNLNGVDALYMYSAGTKQNMNSMITPLKEDGTPIVLEPGKKYSINIEYYTTRFAGCWDRPYLSVFTVAEDIVSKGSGAQKDTGEVNGDGNPIYEYLSLDGGNMINQSGLYYGKQIGYWDSGREVLNPDAYLEAYTLSVDEETGANVFTNTGTNYADAAVKATGVKYNYGNIKSFTTKTVEEMADYGVTQNEDGTFTCGDVVYTEYLGISLPTSYGAMWYEGYDEKAPDNKQDADGNWYHQGYAEYYITDITIQELNSVATLHYLDGNTSEKALTKGQSIVLEDAVDPYNSSDILWSLSPDEYVALPEVSDGSNIDIYQIATGVQGFESYSHNTLYVENKWLTNAMISDEYAYSGKKSMKYENTNLNVMTAKPDDWETEWTKYYSYDADTDTFAILGGDVAPSFEAGKYYKTRLSGELEQGGFMVKDLGPSAKDVTYTYDYKVSFKYYVPEEAAQNFTIHALQFNTGNIWWGSATTSQKYIISKSATNGWVDFEMRVKATDVGISTANSGHQSILLVVKTEGTSYANARNNIMYIDDVKVEELDLSNIKAVYHFNNGQEDLVVEDIAPETDFAVSAMPETIPEGKYFAGWYLDEAFTIVANSTVATGLSDINLYAKYEDYVSSKTYDFKNDRILTVNGLAYIKDGVYYNTVTEGGWGEFKTTTDGYLLGKSAAGSANAFYPAKTDALEQLMNSHVSNGYTHIAGAGDDYAAMEVGEETNLGWSLATNLIIKDENGKPFIAKENTGYKVTVKLNVTDIGGGIKDITIGAGRRLDMTGIGAGDKNVSQYSVTCANTVFAPTEIGEYTVDYTIVTGEMDVPVLSIHAWISGFRARKVAEANGVASYTLDNGQEVYPFEIIGRSQMYIEEVTVTELDSSVTLVNGDSTSILAGVKGDKIDYPKFGANLNGEYVWSLAADKYVAVPETFDGDITVYAYFSSVIGLENYPGHQYGNGVNVSVTDEKAYSGKNSFKVEDIDWTLVTAAEALAPVGDTGVAAWNTQGNQFCWTNTFVFDEESGTMVKTSGDEAPEFEEGKYYRNRNDMREHSVALWKLEVGKTYKVKFKYFVESVSVDTKVMALVGYSNIWGTAINPANFVISADSETGAWLDGEISFTNTQTDAGQSYLFFTFINDAVATGDVMYFDEFSICEAYEVYFEVAEGSINITPGTMNGTTFTAYFGADEVITAPVIIDADGNPVTAWADEDGNIVTEFVLGETYYAMEGAEVIVNYGDCNGDGEINAGDLSALKLYLVGSGEVGEGADCNGDGEINAGDLSALKLYLVGSGELGPQQ
ncbi:MAG: dockerin type I repeat-containing protein [Acutalibacteraceae bacterium]|nr:dockerin type I repeat-containing protein [Acutalibacteraceae bacterium]